MNKYPELFREIFQVSVTMPHTCLVNTGSGPTFIKPDQLDPWIKDQIEIILLPTISHLQLPKLWTAEHFLDDPWSMDYADLVW